MTTLVEDAIRAKIEAAFAPVALRIVNDSSRHAGHAGAGEETHFTLHITAEAFAGRSRIERHRLVHQTLAEELRGPVHALAVKAHAPGEDALRTQAAPLSSENLPLG